MKRLKITRSKFYSIKRLAKMFKRSWIMKELNISGSTITKCVQCKSFKEFKEAGKTYGAGVRVLRLRYLFILVVIAVVLILLNLK